MDKEMLVDAFREKFREIPESLRDLLNEHDLIQERVKVAAEKGDLRENSEYSAALMDQSNLIIKLNNLKDKEVQGKTFLEKCTNKSIVSLGAKVSFKYGNEDYEMLVVPEGWGDFDFGFLSVDSPVAEALLGRVSGENVAFVNKLGKPVTLKILEVC